MLRRAISSAVDVGGPPGGFQRAQTIHQCDSDLFRGLEGIVPGFGRVFFSVVVVVVVVVVVTGFDSVVTWPLLSVGPVFDVVVEPPAE